MKNKSELIDLIKSMIKQEPVILAELASGLETHEIVAALSFCALLNRDSHETLKLMPAVNVLVAGVIAEQYKDRESMSQHEACTFTLDTINSNSRELMSKKESKLMINELLEMLED